MDEVPEQATQQHTPRLETIQEESMEESPQPTREQLLAEVKAHEDIIRFRHNGKPYNNRLAARAQPNQRLVQKFGIDNSFTTLDVKKSMDFRIVSIKRMMKAVHIDDDGNDQHENWEGMYKHTLSCLKDYLGRRPDRRRDCRDLAELVQYVTLRTSLFYLFDIPSTVLDDANRFDDIIFIGRRINQLWINSKDPADESNWTSETSLHKALRRVTGYYENDTDKLDPKVPEENPLNLIMPAYETMWRVAFRCFLEIRFRNATNGPAWSKILEDYVADLIKPNRGQDQPFKKASPSGVLPMDIIKETLRLYPPTRRVHRQFDNELHKADIEACHRTALLGQDDPLVFRPERWQDICQVERQAEYGESAEDATIESESEVKAKKLKAAEEELGFMPFAFSCPSDSTKTKAFGMKMIALLVGVLCTHVSKDWKLEKGTELPPIGQPLEADRAAYETLLMREGVFKRIWRYAVDWKKTILGFAIVPIVGVVLFGSSYRG